GPITGVPPILQPVAHTLLQVQEDISRLVDNDLSAQIWIQPKGMASIGFHLQHIHGVIDRMWSYAMDQPLSEEQFEALRKEGVPDETQTVEDLKSAVSQSEEHTSELQSRENLVCRLLLEKKKKTTRSA